MVSELVELSAVIGDIYDAAIDPILWQHALKSICAYVGGASAVLYWHDSATERSEALHLFNEDPDYTLLYFEKYLPLNPMFPAATFVDAGVVVSDADIMPRAEFVRTRFYKEWVEPQGIKGALSVNLEKGITRTSMINVRLSVRLKEKMRQRLGILVPHLQRAVAIGRLFDQSKAVTKSLTKTLDYVEAAVLLVGIGGAIAFANDPAKKMLAEADLVKDQHGKLRAMSPDTNRILRDVFVSAEKGDASIGARGVAVPLGSQADEPWFAHVLKCGPYRFHNRIKVMRPPQLAAFIYSL
jgi:hypothetical protein